MSFVAALALALLIVAVVREVRVVWLLAVALMEREKD